MKNLNLASPVIFGSQRPQLRLIIDDGKQYIYSMTNRNLYLAESDLDDEGTLTMGTLFKTGRTSVDGGIIPWFVHEKDLALPMCYCLNPCPMLFESCDQLPLVDGNPTKRQVKLTRINLQTKPQLYKCPLMAALLNSVSTEAEKKFAEMYYSWAICGDTDAVFHEDALQDKISYTFTKLSTTYGDFVQSWQKQQLRLASAYKDHTSVANGISTSLKAPALIPQVWLNYTYDPTKPPEHESQESKDMPRRVDFLFIKKGVVHVVEIDDPSHYAKYDKNEQKYEVDEEAYTRNLRADRTLRQQGMVIHRLSNWEILNATESELLNLLRDALDMFGSFKPSPQIPDSWFEST